MKRVYSSSRMMMGRINDIYKAGHFYECHHMFNPESVIIVNEEKYNNIGRTNCLHEAIIPDFQECQCQRTLYVSDNLCDYWHRLDIDCCSTLTQVHQVDKFTNLLAILLPISKWRCRHFQDISKRNPNACNSLLSHVDYQHYMTVTAGFFRVFIADFFQHILVLRMKPVFNFKVW